jgi:hypothetical protein
MGWFRDPARHALASKGICTRLQAAQLREVQHGNKVRGSFGRAASYGGLVKRLGSRHDAGDEIDAGEYERAIIPLFDTLAEADVLSDRGDLQEAVSRLELASRQYSELCERFNVIREEDSREFIAASKMISEKTIARSRIPPPAKITVRSAPRSDSPPQVNENPGTGVNNSR